MKKWVLIVFVAAMAIPVMTASVYAFGGYRNSVNSACGTNYGCGICHVDPGGGGPLNAGGDGFVASGYDPTYFCSAPPPCTDADGDGFFAESGCGTAVDCDDNDPTVYPGAFEVCNDGKDNDCDGSTDCNDIDCTSDQACAAPPVCTDADGDGYFAEAGCGTTVDCDDNNPSVNAGATEICDDGIDNDCDGLIDCADDDCSGSALCVPEVVPENCTDGIDNDGDGLIDCADGDCRNDPECQVAPAAGPENNRKACKDGVDNDGDGLIDCDDPDCTGQKPCIEGRGKSCSDGVDNDGDGLIDCDDPDCANSKPCIEGKGKSCKDGIDNDNDGLIDCDDPDCIRNRACRDYEASGGSGGDGGDDDDYVPGPGPTPDPTPVTDGAILYADNCAGCHRSIDNSQVSGKGASSIQSAIDKNKGGMGFLNFLTPDKIQAIADALR